MATSQQSDFISGISGVGAGVTLFQVVRRCNKSITKQHKMCSMDGRITGMNALRHNKLIDTGAVFLAQVPRLSAYPALLRRGLLFALQKFVCEDRINEFLLNNAAMRDFQFINQLFSHLKIE